MIQPFWAAEKRQDVTRAAEGLLDSSAVFL